MKNLDGLMRWQPNDWFAYDCIRLEVILFTALKIFVSDYVWCAHEWHNSVYSAYVIEIINALSDKLIELS